MLSADAGAWERGFAAAMVVRWLSVPLLLLYVVGIERLPLSSIGMRRLTWTDAGLAVGVGLIAVVIGDGLYLLVHGAGVDANTQIGLIFGTLGIAGRAHVALNAAVVEELFFRGLLIERLVQLGLRPWGSAAVSFVLFVGSPLPDGQLQSGADVDRRSSGRGGASRLLYAARKLPASMLAHIVLNVYVVRG